MWCPYRPWFGNKAYLILSYLESFFYTQKVTYFMFKDFSSPVKASNFNPPIPDLLRQLHRQSNPIKIWLTYAVPPTTTLYPRSKYNLWRAGSSPTIFNRLINLTRSPRPLRAGPTNTRCILDQHTLSPLIADPSIFPERERAGLIGTLVWTGL